MLLEVFTTTGYKNLFSSSKVMWSCFVCFSYQAFKNMVLVAVAGCKGVGDSLFDQHVEPSIRFLLHLKHNRGGGRELKTHRTYLAKLCGNRSRKSNGCISADYASKHSLATHVEIQHPHKIINKTFSILYVTQ